MQQSASSVCNSHRRGNSHSVPVITAVLGSSCWFIGRSWKQRYLKNKWVWAVCVRYDLLHLGFYSCSLIFCSVHIWTSHSTRPAVFCSHIVWLHFDNVLPYHRVSDVRNEVGCLLLWQKLGIFEPELLAKILLCACVCVCVLLTCSSSLQRMDYKWHMTPEGAKD